MEPDREAGVRPDAGRRRSTDGVRGGGGSSGGSVRAKRRHPGNAGRPKEGSFEARERAKQAMLRLLSVRMRSRKELELRLQGRRFQSEVIRAALDDFERVGLVDDRKFAGLFLESRIRLRPRSYNVLIRELRAKGLAEELIKEVTEEYRHEVTEEELARRALTQRLKSMKGVSSEQVKARAARFLAARGFAPSLIVEVVKDL